MEDFENDCKKSVDAFENTSMWIGENGEFSKQYTPYSKMAADLCAYKLALVESFKIKYSFEF